MLHALELYIPRLISIFKKTVFIIFVVILGIIVLEQTLKKIQKPLFMSESSMYILDKDLIYSGAKNKNSVIKSSEYIENVTTNSLGYRDVEFGEKNANIYRIIAVGDSFTFGHGIENNNETYPKKLEQFLNMKGKQVEVFNVAVKGYSPDQEYRQITERLLSLKPDMIIWNFSDPGDLHNTLDHKGKWPSPSLYDISGSQLLPLDARFNWMYMGRFIKERLPLFVQNSKIVTFCNYYASQTYIFTRKPHIPDSELLKWALKKIYLQVENIRKITEKNDIDFVIVTLPYPSNFSTTHSPFVSLFDALLKKGLTVVNVRSEIMNKNISSKDLYFKEDYHPNALGVGIFSEIIGNIILDKIP